MLYHCKNLFRAREKTTIGSEAVTGSTLRTRTLWSEIFPSLPAKQIAWRRRDLSCRIRSVQRLIWNNIIHTSHLSLPHTGGCGKYMTGRGTNLYVLHLEKRDFREGRIHLLAHCLDEGEVTATTAMVTMQLNRETCIHIHIWEMLIVFFFFF